jgi:hypothetical protein
MNWWKPGDAGCVDYGYRQFAGPSQATWPATGAGFPTVFYVWKCLLYAVAYCGKIHLANRFLLFLSTGMDAIFSGGNMFQ